MTDDVTDTAFRSVAKDCDGHIEILEKRTPKGNGNKQKYDILQDF